MLLRIASDLHLEGFPGRNLDTLMIDFLPKDDRDAEATLILAGDISSQPSQLLPFLTRCAAQFKHVFFVPGNHELYRHNYDAWNALMRDKFEELPKNVHATTSDEAGFKAIDGVRFIYTTLWGDGGPTLADRGTVGFYLNDFRLITREAHQRRFTVDDMMAEFKAQKATLKAWLEAPYDGKTVVITHHLPSRRLVSARFWPRDGSDGANGGFVGECDDILAGDHAPAIWVHGHTHDTIDTMLWETRIVCNPAGYRGEWECEHNTFMSKGIAVGKFVEL